MTEEVGYYEKILADAEAEIVELQRLAAFARRKLGLAADASIVLPAPTAQGTQLSSNTIPSDAFFRMTTRDAIKKYLNIVKQPKSVGAITEALERGGLPSKSQKLYTTVYAALRRGQGELFSQVKKEWGLAEWYR